MAEVHAELWPLLQPLDGKRTLEEAIAPAPLDDLEAARMAFAMLLLGIVKTRGASSRTSRTSANG